VLIVVYILLIVVTFVAALALVTFSPIRQVRQPARSLLLGLGSSGVAGLSSIPLALFGNRVIWLGLLIIGVLITGIGGVLIGLLGSAEGISTKTKDDFAPKRGDDQWYGGWGG
jgi:hypothetical protein